MSVKCLRKILFVKFNFKGVYFGRYILCDNIYTCFWHSIVKNRKQKNCLWKTVLKMCSQICRKKAYVSTKSLLEKSSKTKNNKKNLNTRSVHNRWWLIRPKLVFFGNFWDRIFPQEFFFIFIFILNFKCLETCVNCVTNSVTAKIAPFNPILWSSKSLSHIKILFLVLGFWRRMVSNCLKKITLGLLFFLR